MMEEKCHKGRTNKTIPGFAGFLPWLRSAIRTHEERMIAKTVSQLLATEPKGETNDAN
jgi:hypothetical protein